MLSSSLILLLAASNIVHGLPTLFRRQLPGVAAIPGLDALTGALGNIPGVGNLAADIPGAGAANPVAQQKAGGAQGAAKGNKKTKAKNANAKAGKGAANGKKAGKKNAEAAAPPALNNGTVGAENGAANSTLVGGANEAANVTAPAETGAANTTLVGGATEVVGGNNTAIATETAATGNATATDVAGGASTVTVTVTVTAGAAANTTVADGAGATATTVGASAIITEAPAATSLVAAGPQTPDINSLTKALPTFPPIETPGAGAATPPAQQEAPATQAPRRGQAASVQAVDDANDEED